MPSPAKHSNRPPRLVRRSTATNHRPDRGGSPPPRRTAWPRTPHVDAKHQETQSRQCRPAVSTDADFRVTRMPACDNMFFAPSLHRAEPVPTKPRVMDDKRQLMSPNDVIGEGEWSKQTLPSRWKVATALLFIGLWLFVLYKLVFLFGGRPYRMIVQPAGDHALVTFVNPDLRCCTEEFIVDIQIEREVVVDLDGDEPPVPNTRILFQDLTLTPGRVRLRVGATDFDLMELSYRVNNKQYNWGENCP